jgi:hypothetical protein
MSRHVKRSALYRSAAVSFVLVLSVNNLLGQTRDQFRGRLSILPVDFSTLGSMSGDGTLTAELEGNTLAIDIEFNGLSSPATGIEIRTATRGRRGNVAFSFQAGVPRSTSGQFTQSLMLTNTQRTELRSERYYIQLQTEDNPEGELRGWLLIPQE